MDSLLSAFRRFFAAPVFPGHPLRTRSAYLLNVAAMTLLFSAVCALLSSAVGQQLPPRVVAVQTVGLVLSLLLRHWIHQGRIRLAAVMSVAFAWGAVTLILAGVGTIRAPVLGFYLMAVVVSGAILGLRAMILCILLCSATVAGLIRAEHAGLLPQPDYSVNVTQWISATTLFACIGSLTFVVIRFVQDALHLAEAELVERRAAEAVLQQRNAELALALEQVKTLTGLLPVCGWCRKVRSDDGYWDQLESYVSARTDATFTHGICPDCRHEHFPDHRVAQG